MMTKDENAAALQAYAVLIAFHIAAATRADGREQALNLKRAADLSRLRNRVRDGISLKERQTTISAILAKAAPAPAKTEGDV